MSETYPTNHSQIVIDRNGYIKVSRAGKLVPLVCLFKDPSCDENWNCGCHCPAVSEPRSSSYSGLEIQLCPALNAISTGTFNFYDMRRREKGVLVTFSMKHPTVKYVTNGQQTKRMFVSGYDQARRILSASFGDSMVIDHIGWDEQEDGRAFDV